MKLGPRTVPDTKLATPWYAFPNLVSVAAPPVSPEARPMLAPAIYIKKVELNTGKAVISRFRFQ